MDNAACDGHLGPEDELLLKIIADYGAICVLGGLKLIYTLTRHIHLNLLSYLPYNYSPVTEHMPKICFTAVKHQSRQWVFDQRQHAFELIIDPPFEEVDQVNRAYLIEHKGKVVP